MIPFCNILKTKRTEQNITRKELAAVTGISLSAIGLYETDKSDPTGAALVALARALHTSIDELVGYEAETLPEYERYKRYLESLGFDVKRDGESVLVYFHNPEKPNEKNGEKPAVFPNEKEFRDVIFESLQRFCNGEERRRAMEVWNMLDIYALFF